MSSTIVQKSSACFAMGFLTTIFTDLTGVLMSTQMEVDMLRIGEEAIHEFSTVASAVLEPLTYGISATYMVQPSPSIKINDTLLAWAGLKLGMNKEIVKQSCTILDARTLNYNEEGYGT